MAEFFIPTPEACDVCGKLFGTSPGAVMFDSRTNQGSWGCVCMRCKIRHCPPGVGTGLAQKYVRTIDGFFQRVA